MVPKSNQTTLLIRLENLHDSIFNVPEVAKSSVRLIDLAAHWWFTENEYLYDDSLSTLSIYEIANLDIKIKEVYPSGSQIRGPPFKWKAEGKTKYSDESESKIDDYNAIEIVPQDTRSFTIEFFEKLPRDFKNAGLIREFQKCVSNLGDLGKPQCYFTQEIYNLIDRKKTRDAIRDKIRKLSHFDKNQF